jgi:hypothetical protein
MQQAAPAGERQAPACHPLGPFSPPRPPLLLLPPQMDEPGLARHSHDAPRCLRAAAAGRKRGRPPSTTHAPAAALHAPNKSRIVGATPHTLPTRSPLTRPRPAQRGPRCALPAAARRPDAAPPGAALLGAAAPTWAPRGRAAAGAGRVPWAGAACLRPVQDPTSRHAPGTPSRPCPPRGRDAASPRPLRGAAPAWRCAPLPRLQALLRSTRCMPRPGRQATMEGATLIARPMPPRPLPSPMTCPAHAPWGRASLLKPPNRSPRNTELTTRRARACCKSPHANESENRAVGAYTTGRRRLQSCWGWRGRGRLARRRRPAVDGRCSVVAEGCEQRGVGQGGRRALLRRPPL